MQGLRQLDQQRIRGYLLYRAEGAPVLIGHGIRLIKTFIILGILFLLIFLPVCLLVSPSKLETISNVWQKISCTFKELAYFFRDALLSPQEDGHRYSVAAISFLADLYSDVAMAALGGLASRLMGTEKRV